MIEKISVNRSGKSEIAQMFVICLDKINEIIDAVNGLTEVEKMRWGKAKEEMIKKPLHGAGSVCPIDFCQSCRELDEKNF